MGAAILVLVIQDDDNLAWLSDVGQSATKRRRLAEACGAGRFADPGVNGGR
jgi:hypothetical protein